jgi:putative transposase
LLAWVVGICDWWFHVRKPRKFLLGEAGQANIYHVVTRTAGQEILFGDGEKELFRKILFTQLKFSGLRCLAWCFMGNHFHLLLKVPDKDAALQGWTEEDFLGRLGVLENEYSTRMQLNQARMFADNGHADGVAEIVERVRNRLFDLSMFMKELKLKMTAAYNSRRERKGTLWEGRFKSTLVEGNEALRTVAAYIDLNPVRAGLATNPENYRWCSYAAAVAGWRGARSGLALAVAGRMGVPWRKVAAEYRMLLFGRGLRRSGGLTPDGSEGARGGFSAEQIDEVWRAGGRIPIDVALRCRVRYFTDGAVIGTKDSVDRFFERQREHFGARRQSGARKMRGAEWGDLRVLRDLRIDPICVSESSG